MRSLTLTLLSVWLAASVQQPLQAQTADAPVQSFIAIAPDTVEQGVPFVVNYQLRARYWGAGGHALEGNGFALQDVSYSQQQQQPYSQLMARAVYVTSSCGLMQLPGMTLPIDGKPVYSTPRKVFIKPNSQYGRELTYAHNWLLKNGQHPDSLCLRLAADDHGFLLFQDEQHSCFCIMAKRDVWALTGLPVLAYSTDGHINLQKDIDNYNNIMAPYRQQIAAMQRSAGQEVEARALKYSTRHDAVGPLLGGLSWGQSSPYNRRSPLLPDGQKAIIGCVPLAVTMVMQYHQWPDHPHSHSYYTPDGKIYKVDFTGREPHWSTYKEQYEENEGALADDLSQILVMTGAALNAQYGSEATSTTMAHIKHVMCNNMRYSGRLTRYDELSDDDLVSLLYRELDNQRPCLVSTGNHAFICDGYKGSFFHFNLGWHGLYNGYYRLQLGDYAQPAGSKSMLLLKHVIAGIEPQRDEVSRHVVLQQPGTLASQLSDEEKQTVTSLTISGPLNSTDIMLLRRMAGAVANPFDGLAGGSLRTLDMQRATIEADATPYMQRDASRWTWTRWESVGGVTNTQQFTFGHITPAQWEVIRAEAETNNDGMFFSRTDDDRYLVNLTLQQHVIGKYMFEGCTSLHTLLLPAATRKIDDYAFRECASLQTLRLPSTCREAGQKPFSYCLSLETLEAPQSFAAKDDLYEECCPVFRVVRY